VIALLIAPVWAAAPIAPPVADGSRVYAQSGLDNAVLPLTLGYGHGLGLGERDLQVRGSLTLPLAAPGGGDLLATAGARVEVARAGATRLDVALDGSVKWTSNAAYAATALATDLTVAYGWVWEPEPSSGGGYAMLDVAVRQTWATHLRPTETYLDNAYDAVETGWYGVPGGYVDLGLAAGWLRRQGLSGGLGVGYRAHRRLPLVTPPVYLQLELAYDW